jgi:hypothetical protein
MLSSAGRTVDQLWTWSDPWGRARFQHYHGSLQAASSTGPFLTAVRQWAAFCEATYYPADGVMKYHVTPGKVTVVTAFVDWWTSKERRLKNPYPTMENYIYTGLTHLRQGSCTRQPGKVEKCVFKPGSGLAVERHVTGMLVCC